MIQTQFVSKILIQKENTYLVLQRSLKKNHNPGGRDLPWWRLEISDVQDRSWKNILLHGIQREVQEETGITHLNYNLISQSSSRQENRLVCRHLYRADYTFWEIQLSEEHMAYKRVTLNELQIIDFKTESLQYLLNNLALLSQ